MTEGQGRAVMQEFKPVVSRTLALERAAANLRVCVKAPDFKMLVYFFAKPTAGQRKHLFSTFFLSLPPSTPTDNILENLDTLIHLLTIS